MNKLKYVKSKLGNGLLRIALIIFLFIYVQFINILIKSFDKQIEEEERKIRMLNRKIQIENAS